MWALWTILLLVCPLKVLGPSLCPQEPFYFLIAIMKMLVRKGETIDRGGWWGWVGQASLWGGGV